MSFLGLGMLGLTALFQGLSFGHGWQNASGEGRATGVTPR
jgi:hypothetical protein